MWMATAALCNVQLTARVPTFKDGNRNGHWILFGKGLESLVIIAMSKGLDITLNATRIV
jgi:hypothetical protein